MRSLAPRVKMGQNPEMLSILLLLVCAQEPETNDGAEKLKAGDFDGAIKAFTLAIKRDRRSPDAHAGRAEALRLKGKFPAALRDFDRAVALGHDTVSTWIGRSICRFHLSRFDEALTDATRAIEGDPRSVAAYEVRARIANALSSHGQAISDASKAIDLDPANAGARMTRALACLGLRDGRSALRDFGDLVDLQPSTGHDMRLWTWIARAWMGEEAEATRELKDWISGPVGRNRIPPFRALVEYLAGVTTEKSLLDRAVFSHDQYQCRVETLIALRRLIRGDEAGAGPFLKKAVSRQVPPWNPFRLASFHQIERRRRMRRNELLGRLDEQFLAQKSFRAEFVPTGTAADPKRGTFLRLTVHVDLERRRCLFIGPDGAGEVVVYTDGFAGYTWRSRRGTPVGPARLADLQPMIDDAAAGKRLRTELRALAPDPPPPRPLGWMFRLDLEGRGPTRARGRFSMGGVPGPPSTSWHDTLRASRVVKESLTGRDATFETGSPRKRFIIDRKTGFVREIQAWDHDGKPRGLRRTSFTPDAPFPEVRLPRSVAAAPLDPQIVDALNGRRVQSLVPPLARLFEDWDGFADKARARELLMDWAAAYADSWRAQLVRATARMHLASLRRRVPLGQLAPEKPGGLERFLSELERRKDDHRSSLRDFVEAAGARLEDRLVRHPIDSALHGAMSELIRSAFDLDAIETRRSGDDEARIRTLYAEAYETARRS